MEQETRTGVYSGIGFTGALTLAFIVLKLCHVIAWSWWWVLCPIWLPVVLFLLLALVIGVMAFVFHKRNKKHSK